MVRNKGQKLKHLPLISHLFFPGSTSVHHFEFHFLSPHPGQHRGSGQGLWSVCGSSPLMLHPLCTAPCSSLLSPWAAGPAGYGHLSVCDSPQALQGNHALVPGATPPCPATLSLLFILLFKKLCLAQNPKICFPQSSLSTAAGLGQTLRWHLGIGCAQLGQPPPLCKKVPAAPPCQHLTIST